MLAALMALPLPVSAAISAERLLVTGVNAPAVTSYIGEIESIRFGAHSTRAIVLRVEHRAPALTRRAYLAPQSLFGNSIVIDTHRIYEFDVHQRRVITSTQEDSNDQLVAQNLGLITRNYRAVLGPSNIIAGVHAQSLTLLNRYTGEKLMTLWFAENTHLIIGKEAFHKDGSLAFQMRFETLRYTNDIPPNLFSTAAPAGFIVSSREPQTTASEPTSTTGFTPREPQFLPEGFTRIRTSQPTISNVPMVHLLYSDGLRSFSIFENERNAAVSLHHFSPTTIRIGQQEGHVIASGSDLLLTWHGEDHITYTLVGDLSDQELTRIARTLR